MPGYMRPELQELLRRQQASTSQTYQDRPDVSLGSFAGDPARPMMAGRPGAMLPIGLDLTRPRSTSTSAAGQITGTDKIREMIDRYRKENRESLSEQDRMLVATILGPGEAWKIDNYLRTQKREDQRPALGKMHNLQRLSRQRMARGERQKDERLMASARELLKQSDQLAERL